MATYSVGPNGEISEETGDLIGVARQTDGQWGIGGRLQFDISDGAGVTGVTGRRLLVDGSGNAVAFNDSLQVNIGDGSGDEIRTHLDYSTMTPILVAEQTGIALTGLQSVIRGDDSVGSIEIGTNFTRVPGVPGNPSRSTMETADGVRISQSLANEGAIVVALGVK